jgi:rhomboid family GlyGly-CTERM serine protease
VNLASALPRRTWGGAALGTMLRSGWQGVRLTAAIALLAVLAFALGASSWIQFDRGGIAGGQFWRLFTGHLAHWNIDHVLWDTVAFVALGVLCERIHRRRFLYCTLGAAVAISAAVWCLLPSMSLYRGLSGIDSALFALLAVQVLRDAWPRRNWTIAGVAIGAGLAFAGKVAYETYSGTTLFVDSPAAGMTPVPLAHIVGCLVGLLVGLLPPVQPCPLAHTQARVMSPTTGVEARVVSGSCPAMDADWR